MKGLTDVETPEVTSEVTIDAPGDERSEKRPRLGRRYPRTTDEVGATVGEARMPTALATIATAWPFLVGLERQAVEDLGGEAEIGALKREILRLGIWAEAIALALLDEIRAKAEESRRAGRTPHLSRYQATKIVGNFLDLASRRYREVGLTRKRKAVDLSTYLASRRAQEAQGDDEATERVESVSEISAFNLGQPGASSTEETIADARVGEAASEFLQDETASMELEAAQLDLDADEGSAS